MIYTLTTQYDLHIVIYTLITHLCRHDLGVNPADIDTGIETGLVVGFYYVTTEYSVCADTAVVGAW